jgi:hypothetical protein
MQRMRQSREKPYQSEWNVAHRLSGSNGTADTVSQADILDRPKLWRRRRLSGTRLTLILFYSEIRPADAGTELSKRRAKPK